MLTSVYVSVLKNFFVASASILLIRSITLLPIPFILRVLTPADFGAWSLFHNVTTVIAIISGFGLRSVFYLDYLHCQVQQKRALTNTTITTYLRTSIFFFGFLAGISFFFKNITSGYHYLYLISLSCAFLSFFNDLFFQLLRYSQSITMLVITQLASTVVQVVTTIFLVFVAHFAVAGMALGHLFGIITIFCVACTVYVHQSYWQQVTLPTWHMVFALAKRGIPFLPSLLSTFFLATSSRIILSYLSSLNNVGIFACADLAAQLYDLVIIQSLQSSYIPFIFEQYKTHSNDLLRIESQHKKIMLVTMLGLLVISFLFFYLCKPIILLLLPVAYHEAFDYVLPLMCGSIFLTGAHFASCLLQFLKHSSFLAIAWCLPAIFTLLFSSMLIPTLHIYGAVIASTAAYALCFMIILSYNYYVIRSLELAQKQSVII